MKSATRTYVGSLAGLGMSLLLATSVLTTGSAQSPQPESVDAALFSPVGGTTMADAAGNVQLDSSSQPPTNLTKQDYFDAYELGRTARCRRPVPFARAPAARSGCLCGR